jgi:hypothetical protein
MNQLLSTIFVTRYSMACFLSPSQSKPSINSYWTTAVWLGNVKLNAQLFLPQPSKQDKKRKGHSLRYVHIVDNCIWQVTSDNHPTKTTNISVS